MKFKTTKKSIKENYNKILSVSYCNMQNLLKYENPIAYSTRSEGWSCDYYYIGGVLISEGYSPIDNKNMKKYNYDTLMEYEDKARSIIYDYSLGYEEQKKQVQNLLVEFVRSLENE